MIPEQERPLATEPTTQLVARLVQDTKALVQTEVALAIARKREALEPREVRFLREYLGLSRLELADSVGATEDAASRWEDLESPAGMGVQAERLLRVLVITGKTLGQA